MNELVITEQVAASIKWNKEVALKEANDIMVKYDGVEFSEEQLPIAKKEVATLRKVSKEINSQALAIDKELTASVKEFRNEVKEVKAIVDNGINYINDQVKIFETKQKEERKIEIIDLIEWKAIEDYIDFDDSWLLKKFTDEKLIIMFEDLNEHITSQMNTIRMMCTSHNLDSDKYLSRLKTMPLEVILEQIVEASVIIAEVKQEEVVEVVIKENELPQTIVRKLTGTISQLTMLNDYAKKIGVEWSK